MLEIEEKAIIIKEFNELFKDRELPDEFVEFFEYNDLGLPIATLTAEFLVSPTTDGSTILDETWENMCKLFGVEADDMEDEFIVQYNDDETINVGKTSWLDQFIEIATMLNPKVVVPA